MLRLVFGDSAMKKILLGLSSALFVVGSTMGMETENNVMLRHSKSAPDLYRSSKSFEGSSKMQGRHSAPTKKELMEKIDDLIPLVIKGRKPVDALVELLCDPVTDTELATKAHGDFVSGWDITDTSIDQENCAKCAHLLDDIRFSKIMGAVFLAQHFLDNLRLGRYGPFDVSDLPDW